MALFLFPLTSTIDTLGTHIDAILAVLAAVGLLVGGWRKSVEWSKKFEAFNTIVEHELKHNSGSSVKDKAYRAVELSEEALAASKKAAEAAERSAKGVEALSEQVSALFSVVANESAAVWNAIGGSSSERNNKQDSAA